MEENAEAGTEIRGIGGQLGRAGNDWSGGSSQESFAIKYNHPCVVSTKVQKEFSFEEEWGMERLCRTVAEEEEIKHYVLRTL